MDTCGEGECVEEIEVGGIGDLEECVAVEVSGFGVLDGRGREMADGSCVCVGDLVGEVCAEGSWEGGYPVLGQSVGLGFPDGLRSIQGGFEVAELGLQMIDLRLELCSCGLLFWGGCWDEGWGVTDLEGASVFGDVVEEGEQGVEIALGDRVVFMVMASGAVEGQAEPDGCGRFDAIGNIFGCIFFWNDAAFGIPAMVAVEPGGDALLGGGIGEQIACDLFDGHAVEGRVLIELLDDPVPPSPHGAFAIALVSVGVGVACGVEPTCCEVFTEVG